MTTASHNRYAGPAATLLFLVLVLVSPARAAAPEGRYVVDDETILDVKTGLVWARSVSVPLKWPEAGAYCEALELGGKGGWRLPSLRELLTIVDPHASRPFGEAPFELTTLGSAWTRNVFEGPGSYVILAAGGLLAANHIERVSALCVRDAD